MPNYRERLFLTPAIHIHKEFPEHKWAQGADGAPNEFAFEFDYHNGPVCTRCQYSFCIHCNPQGWTAQPCVVDEWRCPTCNRLVSRFLGDRFCSKCGQTLTFEEDKS